MKNPSPTLLFAISNNNNNNTENNDEDQYMDKVYEECLQWLCVYLNEDQLPEGFDPRGRTLDVVMPTKNTNKSSSSSTTMTSSTTNGCNGNGNYGTETAKMTIPREVEELIKIYGLAEAEA